MDTYTIGVDVGGTKTAYGVFDAGQNLVHKVRYDSNPELDCEGFFGDMAARIEQIAHGYSRDGLRGVGIGMPSYIDFEQGRIIKTSNLTNIKDFPARDFLSAKLGGIRVELDNDGHTGALAEHRHGAGRGFKHMLYCPVSTGISSGIIIDNKLFRGSYGFSGESGHMIATPGEGIECGCGNRGCLMSWCSGSMIVKHIQSWIAAGEKSLLTEIAGSAEGIRAFHLDEAYEAGDAVAVRAVEQMAKYMSVWLFNLYVLLNINCFVFGGGLVNMGEKLFGRIRRQFDLYNGDDHPVYFKTAELGGDFGIVGAAELLID